MALKAGTAFVDVQPELGSGFQGAIASKLGPIGSAAAGVFAGAFAAAIGGGVLLAKIGTTFDEAFDTIRIGTGATGEDLAGLEADFKDVFASVPTDAATASAAIADLNTRTGATGETLQGLSERVLELGRITGEDAGGLIEGSTRVFGDWGIAIEEGGDALDALFRASQATGPPVSRLSDLLVKYGAPLRQFGFGFEESAALLGKFEKEGVNTELVMGSLRVALGKIAREGGDPAQALGETIDAIKNAGDAGEANALALELFGARAGPDMAAAIREGRFELGDLVEQVENGGETILGAAKDTESLSEKWTLFKNRVLVAIEPLATRFLDTLTNLFDAIGPKVLPIIEGFTSALGGISGIFGDASGGVSRFANILGPAFEQIRDTFGEVFGFITDVFSDLAPAFEGTSLRLGTLFAKLGAVVRRFYEIVQVVFEALRAFWAEWGDEITALLGNAFNTVVTLIGAAFDIIAGIFDVVLGILTGDWSRAWDGIKGIVEGAWNAITALVRNAINQVAVFIGSGMENAAGAVFSKIGDIVRFFQELPGRVFGALGDFVGRLRGLGADLVAGLIGGLGDIAGRLTAKLRDGISTAISRVKGFFGISSPSTFVAQQLGLPIAQGAAPDPATTAGLVENALTAGVSEGVNEAAKRSQGRLGALDVSASTTTIDRAAAATLARGGDGAAAGPAGMVFEPGAIVVNNPTPEPASVTIPRELRRLAVETGKG